MVIDPGYRGLCLRTAVVEKEDEEIMIYYYSLSTRESHYRSKTGHVAPAEVVTHARNGLVNLNICP